ncbi:MAG: PA14 domain-containing protein, partial [Pseudomonadota bacterium]
KISVVDPDAGDAHTFEVSDDRFEVVEGQLKLKDDIALDHEEAAALKVEVTATDAGGLSYSETFKVEVADVNEAASDVTLDSLAVADGAEGAVVGQISFTDPDAGDSHDITVSDDRFEVVEGELRLKDGVKLDHGSESDIPIEVTVTDAGGLATIQSFTLDVVDTPDLSVATGFDTKYFDVDHTLRKLDDVDWDGEPTHHELTQDINYTNGKGSFWDDGATDTFGAQITGNVEVNEAGTFTFHLGGDDGTQLFINGQEVMVDDGEHSYRTRTSEIELEPGTHNIEVRYFENYGHAGLKLEWEGPGIDGRELVTAPDMNDAQTVSGVELAIELGFDARSMEDGSTLMISDLPEGTELAVGDAIYVVGADGTADVSGWDTNIMTVQPPTDFTGMIDATVTLTVTGESGDTATVTEPLSIEVNPAHVAPPSAELVGGFQAKYFDVDHSLRKIDDVDWDVDPTHQEFVQDVNYTNSGESFWEGGSKDTFGVQLEGQISVETGGTYNFFASGDDGVVVYINGKEVVDNDGLHGFRTRSGEIELEPGTYEIEVKYFENYGHAGLKLEWDGPDTDGRELVTADEVDAIPENGTWDVGIALSGASEDAAVNLVGLPADTILISGEESMVTDGSAADLSDWDLAALEVSPPPGYEGMIEGQIEVTDTAFNGAPVTSTTEFELAVGDAEAAGDEDDTEMMLMMNDANGGNGADTGWDSADPSEADDTSQDDDVMAENTVSQPGADVSDMNVDTHERADW